MNLIVKKQAHKSKNCSTKKRDKFKINKKKIDLWVQCDDDVITTICEWAYAATSDLIITFTFGDGFHASLDSKQWQ